MASCHEVALLACPLVHCHGGHDLYSKKPNRDDESRENHYMDFSSNYDGTPAFQAACLVSDKLSA